MWGKFARRVPKIATVDECMPLPDGDVIDLHHSSVGEAGTRLLLLHGLEGSARSHYVGGMMHQASSRGWGATLMLFRGCGSSPNTARRFYHSGETTDLAHVFATLTDRWPNEKWFLAGVSLGGNVLLKWLGELGTDADQRIRGAAVISVPFDLEAGARKISRGFARIYDRSFLRSLRAKAANKLERYPDLLDRDRLERARTVIEFDDAVTAPVHGFLDAVDYYRKSSSISYLPKVRVPTLMLSAFDDPFLPREVISRVRQVADSNPALRFETSDRGGHVGFVGNRRFFQPFYYAEWRAFEFFDEMERVPEAGYD